MIVFKILTILTLTTTSFFPLTFSQCPEILSRLDWGARPPRGTQNMVNPVPYSVIHHSYMTPCSNLTTCIEAVQEIQDLHMDVNGWDDVGYSFLIGGDGRAYEGRGWSKVGAHAPNFNDKSIGICLMGDFTVNLPSEIMLESAKRLIGCGVDGGYIRGDYVLLGHRDTRDTECPGEALYQEILTWPHKGLPPMKNQNTNALL